jgi:hypothetical protein
MKEIGLMPKMDEFNEELALRLNGDKVDDSFDDQLIGEAMKLTNE